MPHDVAVVFVSFNTRTTLLDAVAAAVAQEAAEVVVVDNASGDGSAEAVAAAFPAVTLVRNADNRGFGAGCNQGAAASRAAALLFLNSDARLEPGALPALLARLADPPVAAVGPRTRNADGTPQLSFGPDLSPAAERRQRRLVHGVRARDPHVLTAVETLTSVEHEPDWLSGSCLLVKRTAFDAVGGFDEGYFLYEEDADLCLRLRRAGGRIVFTPAATAVHHGGLSMARAPERARLEYQRSHLRYYRLHRPLGERVFLRALLAAKSAAGWLSAVGPGPERSAERRVHAEILRMTRNG